MSKYGFDSLCGTYTYCGFGGPPPDELEIEPVHSALRSAAAPPSCIARGEHRLRGMVDFVVRFQAAPVASAIVLPWEFFPLDTVSAPG